MSSIDTLKTLLHLKVSDGKIKLPSFVNPNQRGSTNHIALYYLDDTENATLKIGKHVQIGFYSTEIQVAIRHTDYTKARTACYSALEYLGVNRDANTGIYYDVRDSTPVYKGIDDTGAEVWSFDIFLKGAK